MSTHNIGFYEELTKIIFELSSNTHLISSAAVVSLHIGNLPLLHFQREQETLGVTFITSSCFCEICFCCMVVMCDLVHDVETIFHIH